MQWRRDRRYWLRSLPSACRAVRSSLRPRPDEGHRDCHARRMSMHGALALFLIGTTRGAPCALAMRNRLASFCIEGHGLLSQGSRHRGQQRRSAIQTREDRKWPRFIASPDGKRWLRSTWPPCVAQQPVASIRATDEKRRHWLCFLLFSYEGSGFDPCC